MPSATVEGAEIIHSIILDGAVIEPGAVIARSVVAPGVRVSANTIVSDVVLGIDRKSRVRRKRYGVGQKEIWR
jgi:ADP-glucose pyrophosphorylase